MSDIEVFEIEDRFNPLEDREADEAELEQETDYLPPVPDAELSRRVEVVDRSPRERIERLLTGIPGQQFRILHAVKFCVEPHSCDEIIAEVDRVYPREVSVYDTAQIVRLLERAGALARRTSVSDAPTGSAGSAAPNAPTTPDTNEFLTVTPAPPVTYLATSVGLEAVEANCGMNVAFALFSAERQYLPLYREILELTSVEGGCPTTTLDNAIDPNPLTESPRRFCGYFLGRLENVGAVRWMDNWIITESGRELLASDVFKDQE